MGFLVQFGDDLVSVEGNAKVKNFVKSLVDLKEEELKNSDNPARAFCVMLKNNSIAFDKAEIIFKMGKAAAKAAEKAEEKKEKAKEAPAPAPSEPSEPEFEDEDDGL